MDALCLCVVGCGGEFIWQTRSPYRDVDDEVQYVPAHPSNTTIGNRELATEVQDILLRLNNEVRGLLARGIFRHSVCYEENSQPVTS